MFKPRPITGEAPAKAADPVKAGELAWQRLKSAKSFDDWIEVGEALNAGRAKAMKAAHTNKPSGRKYNEHFSHWLSERAFSEIDARTRGELFKVMAHLEAIKAYRATLTDAKRADLNHPSSCWRAFKCPDRGNLGRPKTETAEAKSNLEVAADAVDDEQEEIAWQRRGLMLFLTKMVDSLELAGPWLLQDPPPVRLVELAEQAADLTGKLAAFLRATHEATPEALEEARERYAEEVR